ncbi:GMP/IMP nucleotidase [Psychromonas sp. psych-6C06]|uniref:GMP/IMP nucleotidase n=1 Tax=Psychromonas sp. psych-6C06 TaxID=2058089 RepID=UPI000C32153E|nr:GMP/IMP nucleotidase [Psychromonas sp. psych-6C06]PKF61474.1 GMP/IMP nucleotidase [Psychromonas sp. psych-6C06]
MFIRTEIDAVLLDMDGTLLDLHYDNHFWLQFVPQQYALKNKLPLKQAEQHVYAQYEKVQGSLSWYCYDYWSTTLGLDIHGLQHKTKHKIQVRSDTLWFLDKLKQLNIPAYILTNAHRSGVQLKMQQSDLTPYFKKIISSHDYQIAKEDLRFWSSVEEELQCDFSRCLFIDDSEKILAVAEQAKVGYLRGIATPDSEKPAQKMQAYKVIKQFSELF